jgi:hypothetical protein
MTEGPFLYDDGPAPLHTGTPRRRNGLLLALFGGTVLVAILMVVTLPLVKGTPAEQARDTVSVFFKALQQGDTATAHDMLCAAEQSRLTAADVPGAYRGAEPGRVVGATETAVGGHTVEEVRVIRADGSASRVTVVGENGPHVCGITPGN